MSGNMSMNDGVERDEEGYSSSDTEMNVRMVPLFNREESMFFLDLIGGEFKINKNSIFIEDAINQHQDDTGNRTWDGSIVLCKALEKTYARSDENESKLFSLHLKNLNVLELGSGTGILSIAASYLGARNSYGTDLKYCLPLLSHNLKLNHNVLKDKSIHIMELDWFWFLDEKEDHNNNSCTSITNIANNNNNNVTKNNEDHNTLAKRQLLRDEILSISIDVILAADVVWQEKLLVPFLSTISMLLRNSKSSNTTVSQKDDAFGDISLSPTKKCILLYTDRYKNLKSKLIEELENFNLKYYFHDYNTAFHEEFRDESMSIITIYL